MGEALGLPACGVSLVYEEARFFWLNCWSIGVNAFWCDCVLGGASPYGNSSHTREYIYRPLADNNRHNESTNAIRFLLLS